MLTILWGTDQQRLLVGVVNADIGNKLVLGLTVHRNYQLNTWWLQNTLGLRISRLQPTPEPFSYNINYEQSCYLGLKRECGAGNFTVEPQWPTCHYPLQLPNK